MVGFTYSSTRYSLNETRIYVRAGYGVDGTDRRNYLLQKLRAVIYKNE
jgi:hypothetical protein